MKTIFLLLLILFSFPVLAQDDVTCPQIVESALTLVQDVCDETARNQACYGNLTLTAEPKSDVSDLKFDAPGDRVEVGDVESLHLNVLDESVPEWGIALMKLQANLPDTLPDQNVTFLLFGQVDIRNAVNLTEFPVTLVADGNVNIRERASATAPIVNSLAPDTTLTANGRNNQGDWVRVKLPDGQAGWVASFLLTANDDFSTLQTVQTSSSVFNPFQAFYLRTGIDDQACDEVPQSGILFQTPKGAGQIEFILNEVNVRVGSTVYVQANDNLIFYVVEGEAIITALDETVTVPAGAKVSVPLDANGIASGAPDAVEPYDLADVESLPVGLLERAIEIAPPLSLVEIETLTQCTISSNAVVNLRGGPGTVYTRQGTLNAGDQATVAGQADGFDGFVWWQLDSDAWVRSDLVTVDGDCSGVPTIDDLPPVPTAVPVVSSNSTSSSSGGSSVGANFVPMTYCALSTGGTYPGPVSSNPTISLNWGDGQEANVASALAGGVTFSLSLNGVDLGPPDSLVRETYTSGGCPFGSAGYWKIGPLESGSYQLVAVSRANVTLPDVWDCGTGGASTHTYNAGEIQGPFVCTINVP